MCVVNEYQLPQIALGFGELFGAVAISALEEQLGADGGRLGADVQPVGKPVKPPVLARVVLIEDIADVDVDLADDGSRRLELRIARQAGRPRLRDFRALFIGQFRRIYMDRVAGPGQQQAACQTTPGAARRGTAASSVRVLRCRSRRS